MFRAFFPVQGLVWCLESHCLIFCTEKAKRLAMKRVQFLFILALRV